MSAVSDHECRGIRAAFYQVIIVLRPSKIRELKKWFHPSSHIDASANCSPELCLTKNKNKLTLSQKWVYIFSNCLTKNKTSSSAWVVLHSYQQHHHHHHQWNSFAIMTISIRKKPFCPLLHPTVVSAVCSWRLEVCIWRKPTKICSFTNHTESSGESEWRDSKHNKPLLST